MLNRRDELGQRSETVRRANLSVILRELHTRGAALALGARGTHRSDPQRDPRPHRRAGRERTRVGDARRAPRHAGPAVPARLPRARRSDRPGPRHRGRLDRGGHRRPRWRHHRRDPGRPAAAALVGRPGRGRPRRAGGRDPPADDPSPDARIGIGVAVVGVVRRSDGVVSMAPNLGWVDVGLRDELVRLFGDDVPIHVANEADLGALAERAGEPLSAPTTSCTCRARSASAGASSSTASRSSAPPAMAARSATCRSTRPAWRAAAGRSAAGRRRPARRASYGERAGPRPAAGTRSTSSWRRPRRAPPSPWAPSRRPGDGSGSAWPASSTCSIPRLVVFGGLFGRIHPFVARIVEAELDRRALAAPRRLVRIVPSKLGVEASLLRRRGACDGTTPGRPGQVDGRPRDVDARYGVAGHRRVVA